MPLPCSPLTCQYTLHSFDSRTAGATAIEVTAADGSHESFLLLAYGKPTLAERQYEIFSMVRDGSLCWRLLGD